MRSHSAIYQEGILKLQEPLELPEGSRVIVYVESDQDPEAITVHRALVRAAMESLNRQESLTKVPPAQAPPLSEERCEYLARIFGEGRPLSEIIIEERER